MLEDADIIGLYRKECENTPQKSWIAPSRKRSASVGASNARHGKSSLIVSPENERIEYGLLAWDVRDTSAHQGHRSHSAGSSKVSASIKLRQLMDAQDEMYQARWQQQVYRLQHASAIEVEPPRTLQRYVRPEAYAPPTRSIHEQKEFLRRMSMLQREEALLNRKKKAREHNLRCENIRYQQQVSSEIRQAMTEAAQIQLRKVEAERKAVLEEMKAQKLREKALLQHQHVRARKAEYARYLQEEKKSTKGHVLCMHDIDEVAGKIERTFKESIEQQWKKESRERKEEYAKEALINKQVLQRHRELTIRSLLETERKSAEKIRRARFRQDVPFNAKQESDEKMTARQTEPKCITTDDIGTGYQEVASRYLDTNVQQHLLKLDSFIDGVHVFEGPTETEIKHFGQRVSRLVEKIPFSVGSLEREFTPIVRRAPLRWR